MTKPLKETWLQSFGSCLKSILRKKKFSMITIQNKSFAIGKIWISRESNCYQLFYVDVITFAVVTGLSCCYKKKTVWRYHSLVSINEITCCYVRKTVWYFLTYQITCSYFLTYFFYLHNLSLTLLLILALLSTWE